METGKRWLPVVLAAAVVASGIAVSVIIVHRRVVASETDPRGAPASPAAGAAPVRQDVPVGNNQFWSKACTGTKPICVIEQNVVYQRDATARPAPVMRVAVGGLGGDGRLRMVLTLPLGIRLQPGIGFQIDQSKPQVAPVEACLPGGCRVVVVLDQSAAALLSVSKQIHISYVAADGRRTVLPIVLDGFGAALQSLGLPSKPSSGD